MCCPVQAGSKNELVEQSGQGTAGKDFQTQEEGEKTMIYKRGSNKTGPNGTCSKCGERGACGVYWYKFMWQGRHVRESTKQRNDKVARQIESAHRTSLAKGEVGIREKQPSPTLAEF